MIFSIDLSAKIDLRSKEISNTFIINTYRFVFSLQSIKVVSRKILSSKNFYTGPIINYRHLQELLF